MIGRHSNLDLKRVGYGKAAGDGSRKNVDKSIFGEIVFLNNSLKEDHRPHIPTGGSADEVIRALHIRGP
jgi:hypothetical protein